MDLNRRKFWILAGRFKNVGDLDGDGADDAMATFVGEAVKAAMPIFCLGLVSDGFRS